MGCRKLSPDDPLRWLYVPSARPLPLWHPAIWPSMVATKGGSGTANALSVVLAAFSGVDTTTAFDVIGTGNGSTTATGSLTELTGATNAQTR